MVGTPHPRRSAHLTQEVIVARSPKQSADAPPKPTTGAPTRTSNGSSTRTSNGSSPAPPGVSAARVPRQTAGPTGLGSPIYEALVAELGDPTS
jgi:hypothetical protein